MSESQAATAPAAGRTAPVSVVLTVYNATWCVEKALDSVMAQTLPPDEVLVCDDGSTDGTPDLVERRYGPPVTVLRLPHRNASATRSVGLARARSTWLSFMDADDVWHPEKLERQMGFLARHPEVRWCCTDGAFVSAEGVIRESWLSDYFNPVRDRAGDLLMILLQRCFPLMSSMLVYREAYHQVGGINPEIVYSHDYDLWLRLAARYPGGMLSDRLVDYLYHPGQLSRRIEDRGLDDLGIMRRIERGDLGQAPSLRQAAAERAAAIEFDLGLLCFRTGRIPEGRARLRRAAAAGPLRRRMLAFAGAMLPPAALARLMRSPRIKQTVQRTRRRPPVERLETDGDAR
ncbi:MAG TPA: glycosyltransferase [Candidatus Udaeobacter sp.]|jgi:glycosyltransferase involved in cell wall biosynthesis|nr:glycosyltransferase [Candidatus Udaeobacter sp.]